MLIQKLRNSWEELDMTVEEGIELLETLCTVKVKLDDNISAHRIPMPRQDINQLFTLANIPLPELLPTKKITLAKTKTKITTRVSKKKSDKKTT
ncbi:MAG: hypothetical protein LBG58_13875 [Planctomycetaceae bacterium]|nr:hypothetical protein [Planctomycetaceae bacterium]